MMEFSQLTVLIFTELLIGLLVLSGVLITLWVKRTSRIRQAAQHLVERIQADKGPRTVRLKERLAEHYRYQGATLDQAVHDLTQVEMRLYQHIVNSYLKQDVLAFQQSDVEVENLVIAYQRLNVPEAPVEASDQAPQPGDAGDETQRLQGENERLSEELRVTMDTIGRMLNEYSYMFAGGANGQSDKGQTMGVSPDGKLEAEQETPQRPESAGDEEPMEEVLFDEDSEILEELDDSNIGVTGSQAERPVDTETDAAVVGDSLMEDLEQIDIDILEPQQTEPANPEAESVEDERASALAEDAAAVKSVAHDSGILEPQQTQPANPEAESLEDEWARALAEDAAAVKSVVDDIDILEPQQSQSANPEAETLEDEWARALAEDAASKKTEDDQTRQM